MERIKKEPVLFEQVEITDASSDGKAVGRYEGKAVFVENAVPGDLADVLVFKNKKKHAEGRAVHFHRRSELRAEPFCEHFGTCGGCKWQNMKYEAQLQFKQKQAVDALTRIGGLELPEIPNILKSEKQKHYRNKLEYSFSNKKWLIKDDEGTIVESDDQNALGFHIPGRFDKVLDIKNCYLQAEPSNRIRLEVKKYAQEHQLSYYDLREQIGFLRNLIIRTSSTGDLMVALSFGHEDEAVRIKLLSHLEKSFPEITSLLYIINPKKNDTINDLDVHLFSGQEMIHENLGGMKFRIGLKSFFQINIDQTKIMYDLIKEWAEIGERDVVYDLYTGTGTIANYISKNAKKVIGIEYVPSSIEDAKVNSSLNGITNCDFFAGDIKDTLTESFFLEHGKPDIVITDPPRSGMHEDVVKRLNDCGARTIVYVSCNPATQARDLQLLTENYSIVKIQALDMFPQTSHVENMVLLKRK